MEPHERARGLPSALARGSRQASTVAAFILAAIAPVGYIHAWYTSLSWGPSFIVSHGWWLLIRLSLLAAMASALVASLLAVRQSAGKLQAFSALLVTVLLLVLSDTYIYWSPAIP